MAEDEAALTTFQHGYKLIGDPFLDPNFTRKVFRYDGICPDNPHINEELPRDPRSAPQRSFLTRREAADLPVPNFKYDAFYLGTPPAKEVTFSNLNDNISHKNLEDMCRQFGAIEEAKVYYHPRTKQHLGIGKVLFRISRSARACSDKLDDTSKMGNIMEVKVDPMGKLRHALVQDKIQERPLEQRPVPNVQAIPPTDHTSYPQWHDPRHPSVNNALNEEPVVSVHHVDHTRNAHYQSQPIHQYHAHPPAPTQHTPHFQRQRHQPSPPSQTPIIPTQSTSRDLESRLEELNLERTIKPAPTYEVGEPSQLRDRRDSSMSSDGKQGCETSMGASFLDSNGPTFGGDTSESLEMRIQKLLKGTSLGVPGGPPPDFAEGNVKLSEPPSGIVLGLHHSALSSSPPAPSQRLSSSPPPDPTSNSELKQSPMDQDISQSSTPLVTESDSHPRRKTLLPTPPNMTAPSSTSKPFSAGGPFVLPLQQRPPLLGTPPKPVEDDVVEAVMAKVTEQFFAELKSILKKDITKRMVETNAFRSFDNWWDFEEKKSKGVKRFMPKSELSETTGPSTEGLSSGKLGGRTGNDTATPSTTDPVATAGMGFSTGASGGSTMASILGLGAIPGMFTGLRGILPKIKRKPRPPSPPRVREELEKKNKFRSPGHEKATLGEAKSNRNQITSESGIGEPEEAGTQDGQKKPVARVDDVFEGSGDKESEANESDMSHSTSDEESESSSGESDKTAEMTEEEEEEEEEEVKAPETNKMDVNKEMSSDTLSSLDSDEEETMEDVKRTNATYAKKLKPKAEVQKPGKGRGRPLSNAKQKKPEIQPSDHESRMSTKSDVEDDEETESDLSESDSLEKSGSRSSEEEDGLSEDGSGDRPGRIAPAARRIRAHAPQARTRGGGRPGRKALPGSFVPRGPAKVVAAESESDEEVEKRTTNRMPEFQPVKQSVDRSANNFHRRTHPGSGGESEEDEHSDFYEVESDSDSVLDRRVPPMHGWPSESNGSSTRADRNQQSRSRRKQQLVTRPDRGLEVELEFSDKDLRDVTSSRKVSSRGARGRGQRKPLSRNNSVFNDHDYFNPNAAPPSPSVNRETNELEDWSAIRQDGKKRPADYRSRSESTDSADAESVDIVDEVTGPYDWPAHILAEHNYFLLPEVGSTIKYRTTTKPRKTKRQPQAMNVEVEAEIPPDQVMEPEPLVAKRRVTSPPVGPLLSITTKKSEPSPRPVGGKRVEERSIRDITNSSGVSRGNRELANLFTAVIPKEKPPLFKSRTLEEEREVLYDVFYRGMDEEDVRMTKRCYQRLIQSDAAAANYFWLNDTHWVDHPATQVPDPADDGEEAGQRRSREPAKKRRRVDAQTGEDMPPVHPTGSARTEGFYKVTMEEKRAAVLRHCQLTCDGGAPIFPMAIPAASSESMILEGGGQGENAEGASVTSAKKKQQTQFREARSEQRRLLAEFQDIETGDLLKFNQLKFRKKHLIFAKSHIHNWGLIALEPIAAEEMVIEYVGHVVRKNVSETREKQYESKGIGSSYLFRIDDDFVIDATMVGNNARFINHSCNPNCYAKVITVEGKKKIVIYSRRDIGVMEEITYDYKFPYEDVKIPCLCGSANCRGTLN